MEKSLTFVQKSQCEPNGLPSSRRVNAYRFVLICCFLAFIVGLTYILIVFEAIKITDAMLEPFKIVNGTLTALFIISGIFALSYSGLTSIDKWQAIGKLLPGINTLFVKPEATVNSTSATVTEIHTEPEKKD